MLLARGYAEITSLGLALGARPETFPGPAGLADLALACSSAALAATGRWAICWGGA